MITKIDLPQRSNDRKGPTLRKLIRTLLPAVKLPSFGPIPLLLIWVHGLTRRKPRSRFYFRVIKPTFKRLFSCVD